MNNKIHFISGIYNPKSLDGEKPELYFSRGAILNSSRSFSKWFHDKDMVFDYLHRPFERTEILPGVFFCIKEIFYKRFFKKYLIYEWVIEIIDPIDYLKIFTRSPSKRKLVYETNIELENLKKSKAYYDWKQYNPPWRNRNVKWEYVGLQKVNVKLIPFYPNGLGKGSEGCIQLAKSRKKG